MFVRQKLFYMFSKVLPLDNNVGGLDESCQNIYSFLFYMFNHAFLTIGNNDSIYINEK